MGGGVRQEGLRSAIRSRYQLYEVTRHVTIGSTQALLYYEYCYAEVD